MADADDILDFADYRHKRQEEAASEPPFTEDSVAVRFAELAAGLFRYCHDAGRWFQWNGHVWREDRTGSALHEIRILARDTAEREQLKAKLAAGRSAFVSGAERLARADQTLAHTSASWDRDPFLLGTPEGTVDLRTGVLRPADPADGITKATMTGPAAHAHCPQWLEFLHDATADDAGLIRLLQQWMGYSLTGIVNEHALFFIYGLGGNGKSVFLNTCSGIVGDYATTAAMETFTASKGDKHPTDLAMLRGARLVTASETEEGRAWAEAKIKQMTGGDPISARFMRQDFFTYKPQFKLTIIGNHKPALANVDDAARRRFNIIPFTVKPAAPDRELEAKLKAEWPEILRWMIEGCLDWQANGLVRPEIVTTATEAYFSDQDLFSQWLEDECVVEPGNPYKWERTGSLFASWKAYAERAAERPGSAKAFSEQLSRRGFEAYRGHGGTRAFRFVQLRAAVHEGDR